MKKIFTLFTFLFLFHFCHAQLKVYAKFTPYKTSGITLVDENPQGGIHAGEIALTTFSDGEQQSLNISSQSTGAGAGKVTFENTAFSKPPGANSSIFFKMLANGTPFQFVDFTFYNSANQIVYKITLKLVAFKSIERAAATCSGDCPGIIENISMQYGGKVITSYVLNADGTPGKSYTYGWNVIKNIVDNDPSVPIQ